MSMESVMLLHNKAMVHEGDTLLILYMKQITIESLLYNTENSGDLNGKEIPKKKYMYMYG